MILNKEYKFIFVHIQKTAGVSIKSSLFSLPETKKVDNCHSFLKNLNLTSQEEYFKFCFIRNPWERLVSWYNMLIQKGIHNDFSRYILENSNNFSEFLNLTDIITENNVYEMDSSYSPYLKSISFNQLDYISDDTGEILVDFIGRFENLKEDYEKVCEKIGVKLYLPHENKFSHKSYREYYKNEKDIEKVYFMYKRDIDFFCYEF
jgi:hypothetical protein